MEKLLIYMTRNFDDELKTFKEAMALVKMKRADVIETSIVAFDNDLELFYYAMSMAALEGVAVLLSPPAKVVRVD